MELAPAHIHGVDLGRAAGDQDLGEASGRGAEIERHPALGIETESIERRLELETAAGHVGAGLRADGKGGAGQDERASLALRLARHADAAAPDEVGGAGACRRQPTIHQ